MVPPNIDEIELLQSSATVASYIDQSIGFLDYAPIESVLSLINKELSKSHVPTDREGILNYQKKLLNKVLEKLSLQNYEKIYLVDTSMWIKFDLASLLRLQLVTKVGSYWFPNWAEIWSLPHQKLSMGEKLQLQITTGKFY
jgi:hypothetical protein